MSIATSLRPAGRSLKAQILGWTSVIPALFRSARGEDVRKSTWFRILDAHCASNGRFSERLGRLLTLIYPPRPMADASGLLGFFTAAEQKQIADQIRRDGCYVFDRRMPEEICAALEATAAAVPALAEDETGLREAREVYDPAHPRAYRYQIPESEMNDTWAVQQLMADDALARIAEAYIGTAIVMGGVSMWWSAAYGNQASSQAAQMFHFDFDAPPRWLKLFVYLNDVTEDNGPHVYVRGSHRPDARAQQLLARGYERIGDEEMQAAFGADNLVEITGRRGTVFVADTRGFHKGRHPDKSDRLIAQVMYCSPVFNDHKPRPEPLKFFTPALADAFATRRPFYRRYLPAKG